MQLLLLLADLLHELADRKVGSVALVKLLLMILQCPTRSNRLLSQRSLSQNRRWCILSPRSLLIDLHCQVDTLDLNFNHTPSYALLWNGTFELTLALQWTLVWLPL